MLSLQDIFITDQMLLSPTVGPYGQFLKNKTLVINKELLIKRHIIKGLGQNRISFIAHQLRLMY